MSKKPIPNPHNSVGVSHSGDELKYWAALFRIDDSGQFRVERKRGPFSTADAAYAAFLPVKAWPRREPIPNA